MWNKYNIELLNQVDDNYNFKINNISRHLFWMLNNVCKLKNIVYIRQLPNDPTNFFVPSYLDDNQYKIYVNSILHAYEAYESLKPILQGKILEEYDKRFCHRKEDPKIIIEALICSITQYLLPRAVTIDVEFDISLNDVITLSDIYQNIEFDEEGRQIIKEICSLCKIERQKKEIYCWANQNNSLSNKAIIDGFDKFVISDNSSVRLLDIQPHLSTLNFLPMTSFGISFDELLNIHYNCSNDYLLDFQSQSILSQIYYHFATKMSLLACDILYTMPIKYDSLFILLKRQMVNKAQYYIPWPIQEFANKEYCSSIENSINSAMDLFNSCPASVYVLPNAWMLRNIVKINLYNYIQWVRSASCLNTNKEIWEVCKNMVQITRTMQNSTKDFLFPTCINNFKNNIKPICPHENKYCGIQIWREDIFSNFERSY